MGSVAINTVVDEYTNRVLGVIKEKYGLRDKGQAIDKFVELNGEEFVEKEVREDVIKEVIDSCNRHIKKYGFKSMSLKELDNLCNGEE